MNFVNMEERIKISRACMANVIISSRDGWPMHHDLELIEEATVRLLRTAATTLPADVLEALEKARRTETDPVAKVQLDAILENVELGEMRLLPMCQDTGLPLFFISGRCDGSIIPAIRKGVERATGTIPLRPNVVDPITRSNGGNNLGDMMPAIHFDPSNQEHLDITLMMKGAGSENMSALRMLNPTQGVNGIKEFILNTVVGAGGKPCPPVIVGVGIGGTADLACHLAKKALLRPLDRHSENEALRKIETEMTEALNRTGIGPMGLGGRSTVLGVALESASCHTASLPVAISLQCWAARRASVRIYPDGRSVFSTEGFW
jgi:fumarate hydratase subunit alpha